MRGLVRVLRDMTGPSGRRGIYGIGGRKASPAPVRLSPDVTAGPDGPACHRHLPFAFGFLREADVSKVRVKRTVVKSFDDRKITLSSTCIAPVHTREKSWLVRSARSSRTQRDRSLPTLERAPAEDAAHRLAVAAPLTPSSPAPPVVGPGELMLAIRAFSLAGDRFRQAVASHFQVGISETFAMSYLSAAGPMSPRQLAGQVGLTPSTVTSLLDRLEGAGLALRSPHPTDRRKTVVSVTSRGQELLDQVQGWMREATSAVDPEQLPAATAVLLRLADGLQGQAQSIFDGS